MLSVLQDLELQIQLPPLDSFFLETSCAHCPAAVHAVKIVHGANAPDVSIK